MTAESSGAHARGPATTDGVTTGPAVGAEPAVGATAMGHPEPRDGVAVSVGRRHDPLVSWGAVWAGLIVTLAVFLLLQFIFFALGWLDIAQGETDATTGLISAVLGLVAFFVGGVVAGATSVWREGKGGLLHGILVWALGLVGIIFLTLFGGGALFGSVAEVLSQATNLQQAVNVPDVQLDEAVSAARTGTAWAVLGLVLYLAAAAIGGAVGGKMGQRENEDSTVVAR